MAKLKTGILVYILLLLVAISLRIGIAKFIPNDDPDDGKVYAQLARNVLEQRVYSHATEPPYEPSLIRVPGYPLFLTAIYGLFGHGNNTAVRMVQAVVDTATCGLVALIAFYWEPDANRKRAASIGALLLSAICPFTAIYVATILSETVTTFFAVATCLAATIAFQAVTTKKRISWWTITGALAGLAVLCRPDSVLFAAAIGLTLVITIVFKPLLQTSEKLEGTTETKEPRPGTSRSLLTAVSLGGIFIFAFCLVLVPWATRNWRVFHRFQPLAPRYAQMPGEFVPRGYFKWLRTWVDDERDVAPFIWSIDTLPIDVEEMPEQAFDSEQEKQRVATLLELYNHPRQAAKPAPPGPETSGFILESGPGPQPTPEPSATPDENEEGSENEDREGAGVTQDDEEEVAMTPEIDAGFAQLARERIDRSKFRYYVTLPVKRALRLWFNTHSQYYPFEGELFPPEDESHTTAQKVFLPLFTALTWICTFLALVGAWYLWQSGEFAARRYLLLALLIIASRVAFFSFLENPEPRYLVELFPFVSILGGIALVRVIESFRTPEPMSD